MSEIINNHKMESPENDLSRSCDFIISQANQESIYNLDEFSDVFSTEEITQDKKFVLKKEYEWRQKSMLSVPEKYIGGVVHGEKRSKALEIIISDEIELNNWFGENAFFCKTTRYDDIVNGTDAVVEFTNEDENKPDRLALAIDSTSNTNSSKVKEKIDRNIAKVLNNSLEIKYFKSQANNDKGILKGVIPVVIGLEAKNTADLINDFAQIIRLKQTSKSSSITKEYKESTNQQCAKLTKKIVSSPIQLIFLEEIKMQLDMYRVILTSENNPNIFVQQSEVSKLIQIINDVISNKSDINKDPEIKSLRNDAIYNLISYNTKIKSNISPKN